MVVETRTLQQGMGTSTIKGRQCWALRMFFFGVGLLNHNAPSWLDSTSACTITAIQALFLGGNSSLATCQVYDLKLRFMLYCFQFYFSFQIHIKDDKKTMYTVELKVMVLGTYLFFFAILWLACHINLRTVTRELADCVCLLQWWRGHGRNPCETKSTWCIVSPSHGSLL